MIIKVTEWINQESCDTFLIDVSKFGKNPFELSYAALIRTALLEDDRIASSSIDGTPLAERFNTYQDGKMCWERLKARYPYVDNEVTLFLN